MSSSLENSTSTRVIGMLGGSPHHCIAAMTGIGLGAYPSAAKDGGRSRHPRSTNRMMRHSRLPSLPAVFLGRARRVSARQGRDQCRVRLFRRRQGDGAI